MAKTFYTERDIEELARQGVKSLLVNDDVVLTELALEKAERLGVKLVRESENPPSAPVRPYISPPVTKTPAQADSRTGSDQDLYERVRAGVIARLGSEVDATLLDAIIRRVLDQIETK